MNTYENAVYLLGIDVDATGKRVCMLLKESGMSKKFVMCCLGLSSSQTFWKWSHGLSIPSTDNLVRISVLLGRPIDELLVVPGMEQLREIAYAQRQRAGTAREADPQERDGETAHIYIHDKDTSGSGKDHSNDDHLPLLFVYMKVSHTIYGILISFEPQERAIGACPSWRINCVFMAGKWYSWNNMADAALVFMPLEDGISEGGV